MTAPAAVVPACTFETLREGVTSVLLEFAALASPHTYGCPDCFLCLTDLCEPHGTDLAEAMRYEKFAVLASKAADADRLWIILNAATGGARQ